MEGVAGRKEWQERMKGSFERKDWKEGRSGRKEWEERVGGKNERK